MQNLPLSKVLPHLGQCMAVPEGAGAAPSIGARLPPQEVQNLPFAIIFPHEVHLRPPPSAEKFADASAGFDAAGAPPFAEISAPPHEVQNLPLSNVLPQLSHLRLPDPPEVDAGLSGAGGGLIGISGIFSAALPKLSVVLKAAFAVEDTAAPTSAGVLSPPFAETSSPPHTVQNLPLSNVLPQFEHTIPEPALFPLGLFGAECVALTGGCAVGA